MFEEDGKRVVAFIIPPRPVGMPVQDRSKDIFWWRDGDNLILMPEDVMRGTFAEGGHDFFGNVCPDATPEDLDETAIAVLRATWIQKSGRFAQSPRRSWPRGKPARRWVIERTNSWMNRFRRVLIRWEKKIENSVAMIEFAFALIIFKKTKERNNLLG